MKERIKKHWDLTLALGLGLVLTIAGLVGIMGWLKPVYTEAATTSNVIVTAQIREYISITASTDTVALTPDLIDTSGVYHIGSSTDVTLTINTNSSDGYSITVETNSDNGLVSGPNSIQLATATGTAATGTDTFGIQASSTDMGITSLYSWATSTNIIGRASTTAAKMTTDASAGENQRAYVKFKASCAVAKPNGAYQSTVTFTSLATP